MATNMARHPHKIKMVRNAFRRRREKYLPWNETNREFTKLNHDFNRDRISSRPLIIKKWTWTRRWGKANLSRWPINEFEEWSRNNSNKICRQRGKQPLLTMTFLPPPGFRFDSRLITMKEGNGSAGEENFELTAKFDCTFFDEHNNNNKSSQ